LIVLQAGVNARENAALIMTSAAMLNMDAPTR
jgi:hypothetical protein